MTVIVTSKTYGILDWQKARNGLDYWLLDAEPHVAIKAKRLFPKINQQRTGVIAILDSPEVASDLSWFLLRYPMEMREQTREHLEAETAKHQTYIDTIESILAGRRTLDDFPAPARPLREYQQIAADLAYVTGGLLLGDDVGLGKTTSALGLLRDPSTLPALIVVPTHLPRQWVREIRAVMPHLNPHIIKTAQPFITRQRNKRKVQVPYDTGGADILVISYSKLAGWRNVLAGEMKTVIFDEVQHLRHTGTEKYTAAAHIADAADRRMGLSATPIYNYGGETYNIFEVLKPGTLGTRDEFFREWGGSYRPNGDVVVKDPKGLGAYLRDQGLLLRRTRHDVGRELPEPAKITLEVDSDTSATDDVMADLVTMAQKVLGGTREERFTSAGQMDMKLRQATGIDKAPYVAEFARFLLESEEKVVLFGHHRAVYDIWNRELAEFNPVMYTGTESEKAKDEAVQRFQTDPECRAFFCALRAGEGLDGLQGAASVAIFGELDWSPAIHHQDIGRLARDGQENEVVAYFLVSEVGSDPVIAGVLEAKTQQAEGLMSKGEEGLFTAQADTGERSKALARAILARAGHSVD